MFCLGLCKASSKCFYVFWSLVGGIGSRLEGVRKSIVLQGASKVCSAVYVRLRIKPKPEEKNIQDPKWMAGSPI